jgi:hypothetical protein
MSQLRWGCNRLAQRGVHLRPPVRAIHMPVRAVGRQVGRQVRGVAEVTNGVGEDQGPVPARTQAGPLLPVPVGILVVHGAELPPGTCSA